MIKNRVCILASAILLGVMSSCKTEQSNEVSKESLKASIKSMEDSITSLQKLNGDSKIPSLTSLELINRLTTYYRYFPKDDYSAECLFKVHIKFSDLQAYSKSVAYGDTILTQFPKFINKDFLLESIIFSYEALILPRDTIKLKTYYQAYIAEPNFDQSKKKDFKKRLKYMNLDFDAYSRMVNQVETQK